MSPVWQGGVALVLIIVFFSIAGAIAYQLYGSGIQFSVPDYFLPAGWATTTERESTNDPLANFPGTLFRCGGGAALKAEFLEESVSLALSDGRQVRLPQISEGDERRYANSNESFVFWNKGITASLEESGATTYASCLQI
jgi:membrane-bound inhibitor of C-type lysozyme